MKEPEDRHTTMDRGPAMPSLDRAAFDRAVLDRTVRDHLGQGLRLVYERELTNQPIPNGHVDLLLSLRHKERDRRRGF